MIDSINSLLSTIVLYILITFSIYLCVPILCGLISQDIEVYQNISRDVSYGFTMGPISGYVGGMIIKYLIDKDKIWPDLFTYWLP